MEYLGILWPSNEQHVLESGDVLFHAVGRKKAANAARDARRLARDIAKDDQGVQPYVVRLHGETIKEVIALNHPTTDPDAPQWIDERFVRAHIPREAFEDYQNAGAIVSWDADGDAVADFPVQDPRLAKELTDALRQNNPTHTNAGVGPTSLVLGILDKIRGKRSRYEAAVDLRKELKAVPAPPEIQAEQEKQKILREKRRADVDKVLSQLSTGKITQDDVQAERADILQSGKLTDADRERAKVLRSVDKKYTEALEIVGEPEGCTTPEPTPPKNVPWFDGADAPVILGNETTIYIPSGEGSPDELTAKYALIEEARAGASHDPWSFRPTKGYDPALQERDYAVAQQEQAKVILGAQWFEPSFVLNSTPSAVDGPPIIGHDGHVLGGNGRCMMIRRTMAENKHYENALKARLLDHAGVFGLSPAQAEGRILVRMITGKYDRKDISARLNAAFTQSIDDHAGAVSLGKRLPPDLLNILARNLQDNTLADAIQKASPRIVEILQREEIITPYNSSEWLEHKGGRIINNLSTKGRAQLRAALLGAAVDDKSLLARMEASGLRDIVERIAPILLGVEQTEPQWRAQYSMLAPMQKALVVLGDTVLLSDMDFVARFANLSLFEGGSDAAIEDEITNDPEAVAWMLWLRNATRGSRVRAQRHALDAWRKLPNYIIDGSLDMFGGDDAPTRARWFEWWGLDDPEAIQAVGGRAWIEGERTPTQSAPKKNTPEKAKAKAPVKKPDPALEEDTQSARLKDIAHAYDDLDDQSVRDIAQREQNTRRAIEGLDADDATKELAWFVRYVLGVGRIEDLQLSDDGKLVFSIAKTGKRSMAAREVDLAAGKLQKLVSTYPKARKNRIYLDAASTITDPTWGEAFIQRAQAEYVAHAKALAKRTSAQSAKHLIEEDDREWGSYRECADADRVIFDFFSATPAESKNLLKSNGFRWNKSDRTWTRKLTSNATRVGRELIPTLDKIHAKPRPHPYVNEGTINALDVDDATKDALRHMVDCFGGKFLREMRVSSLGEGRWVEADIVGLSKRGTEDAYEALKELVQSVLLSRNRKMVSIKIGTKTVPYDKFGQPAILIDASLDQSVIVYALRPADLDDWWTKSERDGFRLREEDGQAGYKAWRWYLAYLGRPTLALANQYLRLYKLMIEAIQKGRAMQQDLEHYVLQVQRKYPFFVKNGEIVDFGSVSAVEEAVARHKAQKEAKDAKHWESLEKASPAPEPQPLSSTVDERAINALDVDAATKNAVRYMVECYGAANLRDLTVAKGWVVADIHGLSTSRASKAASALKERVRASFRRKNRCGVKIGASSDMAEAIAQDDADLETLWGGADRYHRLYR